MRRHLLHYCLAMAVLGALAVHAAVSAHCSRQRLTTLCTQAAAGAQKLFEAGREQEARGALEEALLLAPDNLIVRRELAMQLFAGNHLEEAAEELHEVLELSPDDGEAARKLAGVLEQLGDRRSAIHWLRRAAEAEPTNGMNRVRLAGLLLEARQVAEALEEAERGVELAAGVPEAHLNLGLARCAAGRWEAARPALAETLRLRPGDVTARLCLAAAATKAGRPAEARRHLDLAAQVMACRVGIEKGLGAAMLVAAGPLAAAMFEQAHMSWRLAEQQAPGRTRQEGPG